MFDFLLDRNLSIEVGVQAHTIDQDMDQLALAVRIATSRAVVG